MDNIVPRKNGAFEKLLPVDVLDQKYHSILKISYLGLVGFAEVNEGRQQVGTMQYYNTQFQKRPWGPLIHSRQYFSQDMQMR